MRFFEHYHQEHRQNEIQHKVDLSTLLRKRNGTFHGAFLLRLSAELISESTLIEFLWGDVITLFQEVQVVFLK